MTREHKLALIVGFSLILLVGVLISDHLSSARQAKIGGYGPGDFRIVDAPLLVPNDPLQQEDPWSRPVGAPGEQYAAADEVPDLPSPIGRRSYEAPAGVQEDFEPVRIGQGSLGRGNPDEALMRTVSQAGGTIGERNGIPVIELPPAAQADRRVGVQAGGAPGSAGGVAEGFDWYTVKPGERLFKIAEAHLGNGNRWRELQALNSDRIDADGNVRAGVKIRIPARAKAPAAPPSAPPPAAAPAPSARGPVVQTVSMSSERTTTYTVQRGDTLGVISQKTLGTARRWREIAELNQIEDEDHVRAGKVLKIPAR